MMTEIDRLFQTGKLMSSLSTFGIGGPARYFAEVRSIESMRELLRLCKEATLPYLILGKGSNCLFDDRGFSGAILLNKIDFIESFSPGVFHVGAGYSFSLLGAQTARQQWAGLEFASGIPGTVGGAVFMNAGANKRETCESLVSVDFLDEEGTLHCLKREDLKFNYRTSPFQNMPGAIVGATFSLVHDPAARTKQIEIINYRKDTQPYSDKSAGCIFRNPSCGFAGAMIEQSELKGTVVGGAKVSEKHANFLVNTGRATAEDVQALIALVKRSVLAKHGVELESEVRCIPYQGCHAALPR
ncbi:MAG: UDP-N-acetylmuramate dehydrogenase [Parachlamydia sp.]|nr:UDP-N-acetylmuramate dehydrogenase [Parachlamydia sp.]